MILNTFSAPNLPFKARSAYTILTDNPAKAHNKQHEAAIPNHNSTTLQYADTLTQANIIKSRSYTSIIVSVLKTTTTTKTRLYYQMLLSLRSLETLK